MFRMIEIEKYACNDKREAEKRECEMMKDLNVNMNSRFSYTTPEERIIQKKSYRDKHKEDMKAYRIIYRENNKEYIKDRLKKSHERNKASIKKRNKLNKIQRQAKYKVYYELNKEKILLRMKENYNNKKYYSPYLYINVLYI